MEQETLLGVDFGAQHVGFAIKHPGTMTAVGLEIFERNSGSDEALIEKVQEIIAREEITQVIVGLPLSMSGTPSAQTDKVALFIHHARKAISIPVFEEDERLSSVMVPQGAHDEAAAIILQGYIDRNSHGA